MLIIKSNFNEKKVRCSICIKHFHIFLFFVKDLGIIGIFEFFSS